MNIATPLIPVAVTALDAIVRNVRDVVQAGGTFSRLMRDADASAGNAAQGGAALARTAGPEASEWGEMVRHATLRQRFESLRGNVHQQLLQQFAERGVDLSEPIVLTVDSLGRVLEAGKHLDRATIEELLQSDPALSHDVRQLLQQGSVLWESGPTRTDGGQPRLVVSEKELFFQVV